MILPNWWHEKRHPGIQEGIRAEGDGDDRHQAGQGSPQCDQIKLADVNVRLGIQRAMNLDKMIERPC